MHIYCKTCKKHTSNTFPKKLVLITKNKIKGKSRCAIFSTERTLLTKLNMIQKMHQKFMFSFLQIDIINMKIYCLKCKKDTDNIDPKMFRTKNNRLLMESKCSVSKNKKSRFIKEQDAKGLFSN